MNLFIVDDNKNFLEGASLYIKTKLGYNILEAYTSPLEFLKSKDIHKAECILLDIEMPELNGINVAKTILKNYNNIRLIAVTNHSEKAYLQELICAGFKGCVFKNDMFKNLSKVINEVVSGKVSFPNNIKL